VVGQRLAVSVYRDDGEGRYMRKEVDPVARAGRDEPGAAGAEDESNAMGREDDHSVELMRAEDRLQS
jgi:hypothetical protein